MGIIFTVKEAILIFPNGLFKPWANKQYQDSTEKYQAKVFIPGNHRQLQELMDVRLLAMLEVEKNPKQAANAVETVGFGDKCFLRKGISTRYEFLHSGYTITANHKADLEPIFKITDNYGQNLRQETTSVARVNQGLGADTYEERVERNESRARALLYSGALVNLKINIKAGADRKGIYAYPLVVQFWKHSEPIELGVDHTADMPVSEEL